MSVPFFDNNPEIVRELRAMDHSTKEYRKNLQKVMMEIGGPFLLLPHLKETEEGKQLRKAYFRQLIFTVVFLVAMFVWIPVAYLLVGGREPEQFIGTDSLVMAGLIALEVASLILAFILAFRAKRVLLGGMSYLIDNYQKDGNAAGGQTLGSYKFQLSKISKMAIILPVLVFLFVFGINALANGSLSNLFGTKEKDFSKAGLTITLNENFGEEEIVTQTATYSSLKYVITSLKEEFQLFEDVGLSTDIPLSEYADMIITANALDATVEGSDSRPSFVYSEQANGKDYSYLATVFRGSDAFWTVTFACETKYFADSQAQFEKWADTVKIE